MDIKLKFLGAAGNVTGSCYCLEANGKRILVDCGMYQERHLRARNWQPIPVDPSSVDAVLLTHAHLDHCGLLPKLVREGFGGPVYGTRATTGISRVVLLDSAHIQEEDARFKERRHRKRGQKSPHPYKPLYTTEEAQAAVSLFRGVDYGQGIDLGEGLRAVFHDAGHIFGSAVISLDVERDGERRRILFSGDLGRKDKPIICNPTYFEQADYVIMESTYGDREHTAVADIPSELEKVVNHTWKERGNLVIPSFSIERTHELLYILNDLLMQDRIPHLMVFVDSPMAINVTDIFKKYPEYYDEDMTRLVEEGHSPFSFPSLKMTRSVHESKAINHIRGTCIIIAGSGMCTGGRIKHHLFHNIGHKESTILFIGYQAKGTLGRIISEGEERVRILGEKRRVRAQIAQIHGFSGHAGRSELLEWIKSLQEPPRRIFITHGEEEAAASLSSKIEQDTGWNTHVPVYLEEVELD